MYLIFDTETTGLIINQNASVEEVDNWPRLVQLAWQLHDENGKIIHHFNHIIKPENFTIPFYAQQIHGISTEKALEVGEDIKTVLDKFIQSVKQTKALVGHNIDYDIKIMNAEFYRSGIKNPFEGLLTFDTTQLTVDFMQLKGGVGGKLKFPKLEELYNKLFETPLVNAHDAAFDVDATAKCFFECLKRKIIISSIGTQEAIKYEAPDLKNSNFAWLREETKKTNVDTIDVSKEIDTLFCHLHTHSKYSVLQSTASVEDIVNKAKSLNMPAVAITDLGNLFGAFEFVKEAKKANIKPIIGCEFFVAKERTKLKFTKDDPDVRTQQVLLAKNNIGYSNLSKLSSLGFLEGLYGLFPRIDKDLIQAHKEGLIALSGGLSGEIPKLILSVGETQAEEALQWWLEVFGDDFYLELNDHGLEEEKHLNSVLLQFSKKYGVKTIASNEVFYIEKDDATYHDMLLCVKENEKINTPIGRGRGFRFGFKSQNYYFKSQKEMATQFANLPESISNIKEIIDKVEQYDIERKVLLPKFTIPDEFLLHDKDSEENKTKGENAYLKHLAYEGLNKLYPKITDEIKERIDFELQTIEKIGFPGYFLIVSDFVNKAKEMGVGVGPGRGSAAGSLVAYCLGITNVDPIKYDLLFERFLNPERISLPDIDIDFDDEGRNLVIDYVIKKYGAEKVSQIITFGYMQTRSSIRDVGRVLDVPIPQVESILKLIPEKAKNLTEAVTTDNVLKQKIKETDIEAKVLNNAVKLEGSLRNLGVHPCGIIIAPDDLINIVPLAKAKVKDNESGLDMQITQFDNSVVEKAGLLKMDFLGLKTLSIIKTALNYIEKSQGKKIDIDKIPLDDPKTFELYQNGKTNGTFQFESAGMQKYLIGLKPDKIEDLIAMNALYRPGPMDNIPEFIDRKHGKKEIKYDLPEMEEFLNETYGITIYQEQVMLIAQKIADFTKGDADLLRKAIGKKEDELFKKLNAKFVSQSLAKGHPKEIINKIWNDWVKFAGYAFNKSHSTSYTILAFQTAYLKANYTEEFMAALLSHSKDSIEKITQLMDDCKNMGIKILGPQINHSELDFIVTEEGDILFGLGAIKGTGDTAILNIIEEREKNGHYKNFFDLVERVNPRAVTKKSYEALVKAGALDSFKEFHRRQYLEPDESRYTLIEKAIQFANKVKKITNTSQNALFDASEEHFDNTLPKIGEMPPFKKIENFKMEKETIGLYISGHPLDPYSFELKYLTNANTKTIKEITIEHENRTLYFIGFLTEKVEKTTKNNKQYIQLTFEDLEDSVNIVIFQEKNNTDIFKNLKNIEEGECYFVKGIVQPKWLRSDNDWVKGNEVNYKIMSIEEASTTIEHYVNSILFSLPLNEINETFVEKFEKFLLKHKGDKTILFDVFTEFEERPIKLNLLSRTLGVKPSASFLKDLNDFNNISITVNKKKH